MLEEPQLDKSDYDEMLMGLVEKAMALDPGEREEFLRDRCGGQPELFKDAWNYVQKEQRMNGFLMEPFRPRPPKEEFLEPGSRLDSRFRIERKVAEGGMGVVYEAWDEKLRRRIAIKCAKPEFQERLPPEVLNASEVSHPHVCKIYEIHTTTLEGREFDFLTMEFVDGETLLQRLRRGPVPLKEARIIALQLCEGLAEAHRKQVIHADLKSGNVILSRTAAGDVRAVITDFGLASKLAASLGQKNSGARPGTPANMLPEEVTTVTLEARAGTPAYMSPELLQGGEPSVRSDLYALGTILYEMAAGKKPLSPDLSWEDRLVAKPPPLKHPWNDVLQRCLDPDPKCRPENAEEMARVLAPASLTRRWFAAVAALAMLAVLFSVWTHWRANAPAESARVAVLPFASAGDAGLAARLSSEVSAQLALLEPTRRTAVMAIPASTTKDAQVDDAAKARRRFGATHVIRASLSEEDGKIVVQAWLVDTQSMVNASEWKAAYDTGELRYLPVAIAGMVTEALRLPSVRRFHEVNEAARRDYEAGLAYLRRDSTIGLAPPLLENAVSLDPDSALTHAALAEAQWWKSWATGDKTWTARAADSLREAQRRNPDLAAVHSIGGVLLSSGGWHEQAKAEYLRAIELDGNDGDAYRRLGMVYDRLAEPDKALTAFHRAIEVAPKNHRNHQALGSYWNNRGAYREAIQSFRRTVDLAPDEPAAHHVLAAAYVYEGRFAEAETELRAALALGETTKALNSLGTVLSYQKNDRESLRYFARAAELEPETYLWWLNLGSAYRYLGRTADAARANRRAMELVEGELSNNPNDSYDRACLAYLCARLGERRRAHSEIGQALHLAPKNSLTRRMAVKTYEVLKLREESLAVLRASPPEVLADLSRYPDLADLHRDARFKTMLGSGRSK